MTVFSSTTSRRLGSAQNVRTATWSTTTENGEVTGSVVEVGEGTPIVFLHGLVGLNEHWEGVVERVSHKLRCILFELPLLQLRGEDCSIQSVAVFTAKFIQEHVQEPAIVAGNSFGGHVALRIALQDPQMVRGLVLAGSSGLIEKSMVSDIQIKPSRAWLERKIGELFHDRANMREADVDRAFRELNDRGGARAMVKLSKSARRDYLGDKIGDITVPTLLLWGRQDIVTPPEAAEGFHRMIKGSKLVWFDNCGHAPMIEAAGAFADEVLAFAGEMGEGSPGLRRPTNG